MTIEEYVKNNITKVCDKVFLAPDIPNKKLDGAIKSMTNGIDPNIVIALADTTIFGSAKEGLLITGEKMYIRSMMGDGKAIINLTDIKQSTYKKEIVPKKDKQVEIESVFVELNDGTRIDITANAYGLKLEELSLFINGIMELNKAGIEFKESSQTYPLSLMDSIVKISYIKLLCNYCYNDDDCIDSKEYSEIMSLVVRNDLVSEERLQIRAYIMNESLIEDDNNLLDIISKNVKEESFKSLKQSLMKDMIYLHRVTQDKNSWKNDQYILKMKKLLELNDDQLDILEKSIINDEEILSQRKNDSEITKGVKEIAAKAGAVGVPLAAIYLSGSVMGVSAAGITSGLAALGCGGILGFSSMFTGIGVVALLGAGTYKGVKKITGISDVENNKQREMMIQQIIRNNQKTLNCVIEDINSISMQLVQETKKGLVASEKIEQLSTMLMMLNKSANNTSSHINYASKEAIISHLPLKLDYMRLIELTEGATNQAAREFVLNCYEEKEVIKDDGQSKKEYILNDKLDQDTLSNLLEIIRNIGYLKVSDAAFAAIKGNTKKLFNSFIE